MSILRLSEWFSPPPSATARVGCPLAACLCFALGSVHAQTQAEMNAQARAEFEQADVELNKTYEALSNKLRMLEETKAKRKPAIMAGLLRC